MEVEIIKAKGAGEDTSTGRKIDRLRVAAYCRVSTDDEDQIKSYNSMVRYYTDLIKSNKQWVFAGVFADKAITGTKTDKREEFQLLIQECLSGNIDLVIAKSIPRFARNTLDTLKYVRMLRERNIAVYFEVEKINTLKDGEFLLTILSSVAQQEVENTSAYVKKGLKMKMKRGELVGFQGCLGYDYDVVTKSLSINEEGAETVRYIFDRYVAGAGSTMIARELNEQGISTIKGNPWTSSSVMGIINNEKYKGDILLGKTFTVDSISKRTLENLGEEDRFYIKNHHEPIVSEETFARAQEIRERRNGGRKKGVAPGKREKFSRQYAFSCMLECGFCGANLSRRRWHSSSKYTKTIWQCVESTKHGKRFCPDSKGIPEQVIEDAFIESYRMLCTDHKDVLEEFIRRVEKTLSEDSIEDKIENVEGYQIRIMLHVNDNDDIIRTDEEQIQEVMRSGKLRTQLSIHQTLMNPQTCLLQEQFDHAKVLLTLSIATSEHYCGKIVFQHLNRKKSNDNGIVLWIDHKLEDLPGSADLYAIIPQKEPKDNQITSPANAFWFSPYGFNSKGEPFSAENANPYGITELLKLLLKLMATQKKKCAMLKAETQLKIIRRYTGKHQAIYSRRLNKLNDARKTYTNCVKELYAAEQILKIAAAI